MKNIYGLLLALGLGVAGGMFNWAYLSGKARNQEMVSYIGLASDIERGQRLEESHLATVSVPRLAAGNLDQFAIPWSARQSVIGQTIARFRKSGSLLLQDDLNTPPQEVKLKDKEGLTWIPVDTRTFVPSLVVPGDMISFVVLPPVPTRSAPVEGDAAAGGDVPHVATPPGSVDTIGPFRVLSLGNRLGSAEVLRAAKVPQTQEGVVGISVKVDKDKRLDDPQAAQLLKTLNANNFRPMGVLWEPQNARRKN